VVTNPPFAAPDEAEHYVRAIGLSEGHLIGRRDTDAHIGIDARQVAWTRQATRLVRVPPGLDPLPFTCQTGSGGLSAECLNTAHADTSSVILPTAVGNYEPLPYLLPAAVMRLANSPPGALRLGRAAGAVAALALLVVAMFALYDGASPMLSILGLLLAVTPMVLFCGAILNGSGLEITSNVAFFACLLRWLRPSQMPRRWYVATAVSGATLALSRPASPLWLVIAVCVALAWTGRGAWRSSRLRDRAMWTTVGAVLLAIGLNRVWEAAYGSHVKIDTDSLHAGLVAGFHEWWRALPELVGKFGYLNVKLPLVSPLAWLVLTCGVFIAAMRGRRDRNLLLFLAVVGAVGPVVFYALFTRPTGFGLQGRQLLPAMVILPLLAGEIYYRRREAMRDWASRWLVLVVPIGVAVVQVGAWYVNSKRFAVGTAGPVWFLAHPSWSPPAGWIAWTVLVILALGLLVTASVLADRQLGGPTTRT
jgi:Predicted membrane protein (DUF2142)